MKLKYVAFILSAITFSQATLAAAPLCRSVLRSFTQEQINAAIEDFTRLTLQADNAQADGDNSTMTRSLLTSKRLKEKELLESLNISREELRKLVRAHREILQKRIDDSAEAKNKARESQAELIGKTFKIENHLDIDPSTGLSVFELVANSTKVIGNNKALISLEDGTMTYVDGIARTILPDALFTTIQHSGIYDFAIINPLNGNQVKIPHPKGRDFISSDKQSIVYSERWANAPFEYLQVDKNGTILNQGTMPELFGTEIIYVGQKEWLLRRIDGFSLFNPQTKALKKLNIESFGTSTDLHNGRIGIRESNKFHVLDTNTNQRISKEMGAGFEVLFSSSDFIWFKFRDPSNLKNGHIRIFDINTLEEVADSRITVGDDLYLEITSLENSNLVSVSSGMPGMNKTYKGIYRNDDLFHPIFDTAQVYSDKSIMIKKHSLSEDGKSLIIVGTNKVGKGEKYFIDVWKLK